jgi:hypothetical protein
MSAKSARAWLSLIEIATGPIVPALPIFLQIRVQFKAKSVFITPLPGGRNPAIRPPGLRRERIDTQSQTSISIAELGAGVAPTSTKLFSGIAKQTANLLKSERPGGSCEGVGEGRVGDRALVSLYF